MATAPDQDVVDFIEAGSPLGGVTWAEDTNIFRGPVRAFNDYIPHQAIFALATGGPAPEPFLATGSTDFVRSYVQLRVRSNANDHVGGQTIARAIRDRLHKAAISGYVDSRVREAEPIYLGMDSFGHHEWSINTELWHRR